MLSLFCYAQLLYEEYIGENTSEKRKEEKFQACVQRLLDELKPHMDNMLVPEDSARQFVTTSARQVP